MLCLVLLFTSGSTKAQPQPVPGQVSPPTSTYNSGNLIPNAGQYNGWQDFTISTALPSAIATALNQNNNYTPGLPVQVNGINYGYTFITPHSCIWGISIFGHCLLGDSRDWSAGTSMTASITGSNGQLLHFNWNPWLYGNDYSASYNWTATFNKGGLPPPGLGTFNMSVNSWGDSYVVGVYAQANYTVDNCYFNQLYSPKCSGFQAAVQAKSALPQNLHDSVSMSAIAKTYTGVPSVGGGTYSIASVATDPTKQSLSSITVGGATVSTTSGSVSAVDNVPQIVKDSQVSQPVAVSSLVDPTTQQKSTQPTSSVSITPGASNNTTKITNTSNTNSADQLAPASQAIANSQPKTSTDNAGNVGQSSTTNTSATKTASSDSAIALTSAQSTTSLTTQNLGKIQIGSINPTKSGGVGITVITRTDGGLSMPEQATQINAYQLAQSASTTTTPLVTSQTKDNDRQFSVEVPQPQQSGMGLTVRTGNPVAEATQPRMDIQTATVEQRVESIRSNVHPNELAGGVDIAAMAVVPQEFSAYSLSLRDAAFYEPKEIYRNQQPVDNVRALRQMASERLYQQMLDMQYKIGE